MVTQYTREHMWLRPEDKVMAVAGITQHAQDTLGDIVFVELPTVGQHHAKDAPVGVVESSKTAADLHMPVAGEIVEVNEALRDDPSRVSTDPLGQGWIFRFRPDDAALTDETLMDEAAYAAFTA